MLATLTLALFAAPTPVAPSEDHAAWIQDYDEGLALARRSGKDLLIDFTGSDWCPPCKRLHSEVLSQESFIEAAKGDYVLVMLDYPRGKEAISKVPNAARNAEVSARYKITAYPTVLLTNSDGHVFGRTGSKPGGPEPYLEHLAELRTQGKAALKRVMEMTAGAKSEEPSTRAASLEKVIEALNAATPEAIGTSLLIETAKLAFEVDAENKQGLKQRAVAALLKANYLDSEVSTAARAVDPKNAAGLIERSLLVRAMNVRSDIQSKQASDAIERFVADKLPAQDPEVVGALYINVAFWASQGPDREKVKTYAQMAKDSGTKNEQILQYAASLLGS